MAVTNKVYSNFVHLLLEDKLAGSILDQTIKVALVTSSYTVNQETHDYFDDITNEVVGTGYSAGGATLGSKTNTMTTRVTTFDAANTTWTSSTVTARGAVIYYASGAAATSLLICHIDFGADKTTDNGTLELQYNASGIFTLTTAA